MLRRLACLLLLVASLGPVTGAEGTSAARVRSVDSVTFNVADLERAVTFYTDVLGFQKDSEVEVAG
jgi:4-hydroxyphenylpyruvate dioxygenase-like putative hemolysin